MKIELWFSLGAGILLIVAVVSGLLFLNEECRDFKEAKLLIDGRVMWVAIADTQVEQGRGLAGCSKVPEGRGMYFVNIPANTTPYWMRGMEIPIDILWVAEGKVVGIETEVPPVDKYVVEPPLYRPPRSVNGVLEIGAGKAKEYGIKEGSTVTYVK